MKKEWFLEWFDSPYYHVLYRSHDDSEAHLAIDAFLQPLDLAPDARVLDLACGKGRYARYLAEKGFDVTGLDISEASISYARQFEQEQLAFYQHDMRKPFRSNYFDAVLNMFTSFGYFNTDHDHLVTLKNVYQQLRPGGLFLLDFFNTTAVCQNLIPEQVKTIEGIDFHLQKEIQDGVVYKTVDFTLTGQPYHFQERVRLFTLTDFQVLFAAANLRIRQTYGDYQLSPFDEKTSSRLILIAEKIHST